MSKRYVLFAMTALLAVALAVPAFGGPSNPVADTFASAKSTAKKALKKAKNAQKKAKKAQQAAAGAQDTADFAAVAADAAQGSADAAQASADSAQSTANSKFGQTTFRSGDTVGPDSSNSKLASAGCETGEDVTGGGFASSGAGSGSVGVITSSQYLNGWVVRAQEINATASTWSLSASVTCASP